MKSFVYSMYPFGSMSRGAKRITASLLISAFIVFLSAPLCAAISESSNIKDRFLSLPAYLQLECAEHKIKQLIEKMRNSGKDYRKLERLEQGQKWFKKVIQKYDDFTSK